MDAFADRIPALPERQNRNAAHRQILNLGQAQGAQHEKHYPTMLTIDEALNRIREQVVPASVQERPLNDCLDLVLGEDVLSTLDSPPFDKSMMDGYAVRVADLLKPCTVLRVVGEVTAGTVYDRALEAGQALRIMTGAPVPAGAEAIVRIEETELSPDGTTVTIHSAAVPRGQFIIRRGNSMQKGERILASGTELGPRELGLLAELGITPVPVRPRPTVAIIATGNELVPVDRSPGEGEIRNSNETMLCAQVLRAKAEPVPLGIARDDERVLLEKISAGLQHDFLCLSGGVSAGVLDLVPKILQASGVREVFHKVDIRPGKPIWFGTREPPDGRKQYIFGLPGNPVSSMVCFELFVRFAVRLARGVQPADPPWVSARWSVEFNSRSDRTSLVPCRVQWTADGAYVAIDSQKWKGSFDLRGTVGANALALIPAGERTCQAGEKVDILPLA